MSMSGHRSSQVTREKGKDIVGGQHRKYSDLNIEMLRPRSLVQSHVSM